MNLITKKQADKKINNGAWYEGVMTDHDGREYDVITDPATMKTYHVLKK